MGRKGDSKRKPKQTKVKPLANNNASGSVSSMMQSAESQPAKPVDSARAGVKSPNDRQKKNKKG